MDRRPIGKPSLDPKNRSTTQCLPVCGFVVSLALLLKHNFLLALKKIIIAIDGHSSCGKSTLAKELGKALDYAYISTGDMYRAVTLYFLENDVDWKNPREVEAALQQIRLDFRPEADGTHILLNGRDVHEDIRRMEVARHVSEVSAIPEVRREMVRRQRLLGRQKGIVMDGRDIGTVVFPDAELKIFLTADVEERARRRFEELKAKGLNPSFEEVKANLEHRDLLDSTRADSPLKKAPDARVLDNTHLDARKTLEKALQMVQQRLQELEKPA